MHPIIERIRTAKTQAKAHNFPMAVVTVDDGGERRFEIWSHGSTRFAEFAAVGGVVELIIHPNGKID